LRPVREAAQRCWQDGSQPATYRIVGEGEHGRVETVTPPDPCVIRALRQVRYGWSGAFRVYVGPVGLSEAPIDEVLLQHRERLRLCFDGNRPSVSGLVVLEFSIAPDGGVAHVDTLVDEAGGGAADCFREIVGALQFPEPADGTTVVRWMRVDFRR
ncbi:MAG: hypothetical protein AAGE52_22525, partial [Myxococcota bacterium]